MSMSLTVLVCGSGDAYVGLDITDIGDIGGEEKGELDRQLWDGRRDNKASRTG